jgi:elongator complex protein 5
LPNSELQVGSMSLLPPILANSQRPHQPLLLLQSSTSQSCLSILRKIINHESHKVTSKRVHTLLFCFLYPSSSLAENANLTSQGGTIEVFDYTAKVPGYDDSWVNPCESILASVRVGEEYFKLPRHSQIDVPVAPTGPLSVIIDSVDSLASDIGSDSQTYKFLHTLVSLIRARPSTSLLSSLHLILLSMLLFAKIHLD